jgi:localization factor PodJL
MTLGEWLNRMIIEGEIDPASLESFGEPSRPSLAVNNDRANTSYYETARGGAPARIEAAEHPADEVGRVAIALDRLTDRIEAAEKRSAHAISGIDESVRGALQRLASAEREQVAVAARFEGAVDDIKTDQMRNAERLRRMEAEAAGPRSAEALRALEGALGKVAGHLYEGEARTRETISHLEQRLDSQAGAQAGGGDQTALVEEVVARLGQRLEAAEGRTAEALQALNASFSALDGRLQTVESRNPGEGVQKRLDELSNGLTQRMEAARMEMAAKLRESADGRFDRMERKLGEMTAHVQAAEQRSAQAIERMGREVVGMADALNRRVQTSEARNTAAIEQVAASIDQKLNRADSVQAQALEKLGTEIARITEKLAERISNAERRNALAIDDVGDQVTRVTDRLNQRHERTSQELVDRIRQSEERTARILEEAREKIDSKLDEAQKRLAEQAAAAPAARPAPSPFDGERYSFGGEAVPEDVFDPPTAFIPTPTPPVVSTPARTAAPAAFDEPAFEAPAFPASEPAAHEFGDEDFAAADGFAAAPEPEAGLEPAFEAEPDYDTDFAAPEFATSDFAAPEEPPPPARPLSTREVIEQARAAARQAAAAGDAKGKDKLKAPKKPATSLFAGFGAKGSEKKAKKGAVKTALMVSATAAFMGVGAAGYIMSSAHGTGALPERVALGTSNKATGEIRAAEADTSPAGPRATVALTSQPAVSEGIPIEGAAALAPPPSENAQALYDDGVRRIEAKDRTGLDALRKAANLGLPRAQFYLAKMYEAGEGGVKKDMPEARRWTERAATAGEPRAMHNLALYYYKGDGGERNSTKAASWFRRAADLGLVDSQFNLAQLYEGGWGVSQNPTEAYKWYLIAAKSGDSASRGRAMALRTQLTAEGQRIAERSAYGFRSQAAAAPVQTLASAAGPSAGLATAQRALSKLGYYQGPQDGVTSAALQGAIAAYQRDQNLSTSGALDGETLSRLSAFSR